MTDNATPPTRSGFRRRVSIGLLCCVGFGVFIAVLVWRKNQHAGSDVNQSVTAIDSSADRADVVSPSDTELAWETEEFADKAQAQLNRLGDLFAKPTAMSLELLREIAITNVRCSVLRPTGLTNAFDSPAFTVHRSTAEASREWLEGFAGLQESLVAASAPLLGVEQLHFKFKIISVEAREDSLIATDVLFQISGVKSDSSYQQNAVWHCVWRDQPDKAPLLEQIALGQYEEVTGKSPGGNLFADCTESVFRNETSFREQLIPGIDFWRSGIQSQYLSDPYGHHGIAIGDADGDGLDDLYACQPAGLPNRLYIQNSDGTVRDVAREAGVDWLDRSIAALFLDLDGDGDQDLVVVLSHVIIFLANDGKAHFTQQASVESLEPGSVAAADYDLDGDLDIYVANYGARFLSVADSAGPEPYHDANNGGANMLLRNDGNWVFSDVTVESGLNMNNTRWSLAVSWEDFDNDGDSDLYVANDFGRNNLYRNDNGHFVDIAAAAGVEDIAAGMSVSWADYDHDGRMDLYVGNMYSSAGLRIANQQRFQAGANSRVRSEFQRHARGNSLFRNLGDGKFADVSVDAGVNMGRWAWGSVFVDINNDGRDDIVVANGFVTSHQTQDL